MQYEIKILTEASAWATMLKPGTILWRDVYFKKDQDDRFEVKIPEFEFQFVKGSWVARLDLYSNRMLEPEAIPVWDNNIYNKGLLLFVRGKLYDDWTHLIIRGVSSVLSKAGRQPKGGAVFAEMATPFSMQKYKDFRLHYFEFMRKSRYKKWYDKLFEAADIEIDVSKYSGSRLILQPSESPDYFKYLNKEQIPYKFSLEENLVSA